MHQRISRRNALQIGTGAVAALLLPARVRAQAARTVLPIPGLLEPDASGIVRLRLAEGRHSFMPGSSVASAGINGAYLGPVVRLKTGSEATLSVENALSHESTLHWHGLFVSSDLDGGPHCRPASTIPGTSIQRPPSAGANSFSTSA
jgi:blue copper oxidase